MNWSTILAALPSVIAAVSGYLNAQPAGSAQPPDLAAVSKLLQTEVAFIKIVQEALNSAQAIGVISFGVPLVVDGIAGPKTVAAAGTLLTKFNLR